MKFKTIVIDPPWSVKFIKLKIRPNQIKMPYETMNQDELKNIKVDLLADEDCGLFLWTTHTFLPDALELMKYWGFKYHCIITWNKTNGRPCCGFKRKTEFVVYGYKGKINVNQRGNFIPTLFTEKLTTHSTKPESFYKMLLSNTPPPRIDIFARYIREGYQCIGNGIDGKDINDVIKEISEDVYYFNSHLNKLENLCNQLKLL